MVHALMLSVTLMGCLDHQVEKGNVLQNLWRGNRLSEFIVKGLPFVTRFKKKKKCAQEVAPIMVEEWRSNSVNTIIRRCIHQGHAVDIIEHPKQQCYSSMYHHWCNFLHSFQCAIWPLTNKVALLSLKAYFIPFVSDSRNKFAYW